MSAPQAATPAVAYPLRGELWFGNLDPVVGHEQAGDRPLLVVSQNRFNALPRRLVAVVPLTRTARGDPLEVAIVPPEANVPVPSVILCYQPRTISHDRLRRRLGVVTAQTLADVDDRVRRVFGY